MEFRSVYELNESAKALLEGHFSFVSVEGEISRLTRHSSGHWYFTLKDDRASISAAMFKGANAKVNFIPKDGMKVLCSGKISIYSASGSYQINVSAMKEAGEGGMDAAFKALCAKLVEQGICERKINGSLAKRFQKPLPRLPRCVGIVTSLSSAAFADIQNRIIAGGYYLCDFICFDTLVQGRDAPASIISALQKADGANLDAIILARGGGSKEDLWCFNDESLAYTIAALKTPIISAVGHEIDYSISDFVADHRSITPTASVVDLLPSRDALEQFIDGKISQISKRSENIITNASNRLKIASACLSANALKTRLEKLELSVNNKKRFLKQNLKNKLNTLSHALEKAGLKLTNKKEIFEMNRNSINIFKAGEKISLDMLNKGDTITLKSAYASKDAQIIN